MRGQKHCRFTRVRTTARSATACHSNKVIPTEANSLALTSATRLDKITHLEKKKKLPPRSSVLRADRRRTPRELFSNLFQSRLLRLSPQKTSSPSASLFAIPRLSTGCQVPRENSAHPVIAAKINLPPSNSTINSYRL